MKILKIIAAAACAASLLTACSSAPQGLVLREVAEGLTPEALQKATEPILRVAPDLKTMTI